jgi:hypothetical protein
MLPVSIPAIEGSAPVLRADGDPKPPGLSAANGKSRRRPFPAIKTPHERALGENGEANLRAAQRAGIKFFGNSVKRLKWLRKSRKADSGFPRRETIILAKAIHNPSVCDLSPTRA